MTTRFKFHFPRLTAACLRLVTLLVAGCSMSAQLALADLPAFPGALGQGAASVGGRGGDVYHVTTLADYNPDRDEPKIKGSLRHAIDSAEGPRTIVFDVAGPIELHCRLEINKTKQLTVAGQTSPGGITLWGYPTDISRSSDIIVRYVRFRPGDINAALTDDQGRPFNPPRGKGNKDIFANSCNGLDVGFGSDRIIIDHVSVSWGMDECLSATNCRSVTIQNSIIAEALNDSFHYKGPHGYGSLIRGVLTAQDQDRGVGGFTLYGNLWIHNVDRNPSIGGQQRLLPNQSESDRGRTDLNLVNNVICNWGQQPTRRSQLGDVRVNMVGNYYINGSAKKSKYIFRENEVGHTQLFHQDNFHDADQDGDHNGRRIDTPEATAVAFHQFDGSDVLVGESDGTPFNFFYTVRSGVVPAEQAYEQVTRAAGASLWRDAIDERLISDLVHRAGSIIDSQEQLRNGEGVLPGIDDLPTAKRPADFDTDRDGMPNDFETQNGLDPDDPRDRNLTNLNDAGYTNLEVYLNSLVDAARNDNS